jgi:predicted ATPase/class 3 adenylate cyclase
MQDAQLRNAVTEVPEGVVTLVFTDIQRSSDLWERHRDAFKPVLEAHHRLMREAAARWRGVEVKTEGDAFFLVFDRASEAVRFAVDAQRAFATQPWSDLLPSVGSLLVRIGMHTGEPLLERERGGAPDYLGPAVNRAARVAGAGHGGQIVVSDSTRSLAAAELPPEIVLLDLGEHRLKGVGSERLWQVGHPDLPREFPPLNTLDRERHNLPLPLTPFIGRKETVEQCVAILRDPGTRLLSLVGFGGMGKTRTALQVAELCAGELPDGVWWVEAEEALNGEGLIQRIAYHLRLHLQPQPSVREQLWSFLREREMLLVLDNTEQIPDAAQVLGDLLMAAPRVRCLVTTRRALEIRSERAFEILPLPPEEAQSLLVERARSRQATFETTEENRADIAELCERLEGVPLAIELAATRIVAMTPREMLRRLDDRFRLLQTRAPDLPPRQRALRAAIDWSYELLSEEDRELFVELSVFAGGFTMESAEAVCPSMDVFEGVTQLRRQSLLRAETQASTQQTRFLMLEAVRRYAAERLTDESVRERHTEYFLQFAEERVSRLRSREEAGVLLEMTADFDNLLAALLWAADTGRHEQAARLSLAFYLLVHRRGFWAEARRCLELGLRAAEALGGEGENGRVGEWGNGRARSGSPLPPLSHSPILPVLAALRHCLASTLHDMAEYEEARRQAEAALAVRRELEDPAAVAETLNLLGLIAGDTEATEESRRLLEEARELLCDEDHARLGMVLHNLARLCMGQKDCEAARTLYEAALQHRRAAGDARGEAETLGNMGVLAQNLGQTARARQLYLESLRVARTLRDRYSIAILLNNLGELAEAGGELELAVPLFEHARQIFQETQSGYVDHPQEALGRIESRVGADRWSDLRLAAGRTDWEQLIEQIEA